MGKIKLLLFVWIAILVTAGCGNVRVPRTLHPCTNLDQPKPFESIKRFKGSLLFEDNLSIVATSSTSSKELFTLEPGGTWEIAGLNPSGEWFAYQDYPSSSEPPLLHLISYRGEQMTIHIDPYQGGGPLRPLWWVNDKTLLMIGEGAPIAFLDAFAGSWLLELVNDLPNRAPDTGIALSPDLKRALYVLDSGDKTYLPLVLWDFEQRKEVWRADKSFSFSAFLKLPGLGNTSWSPDSTVVAFTLDRNKDYPSELLFKQRMYLVDARTGELLEFRTEAKDNRARTFTWSPDGRYIAIVTGLLRDTEHPGITIYNLKTDVATDLCPMRKLDPWFFDQATGNIDTGNLAWSPDSRYLVFGQGKDDLSEDNRISMLDIYTGEVTVLKEGPRVRFIGWSPYDWTKPEK